MNAAIVVLSVVLAVTFGASGIAMIRGRPLLGTAAHQALSSPLTRLVGAVELIGAAGLVSGLVAPVAGLLAAGYLSALSLGVVGMHLRIGDSLAATVPAQACATAALALFVLYVAV